MLSSLNLICTGCYMSRFGWANCPVRLSLVLACHRHWLESHGGLGPFLGATACGGLPRSAGCARIARKHSILDGAANGRRGSSGFGLWTSPQPEAAALRANLQGCRSTSQGFAFPSVEKMDQAEMRISGLWRKPCWQWVLDFVGCASGLPDVCRSPYFPKS